MKRKPIKRRARRECCTYQKMEGRQLLATLQVDTVADVVDPGDGFLSLREAILASNTNAEDDMIVLPAGTYEITREGRGENAGQVGDFDVLPDGGHRLTIQGAGAAQTVVDARLRDRVFQVHVGSKVVFEGLRISGGDVSSTARPTENSRGGGIWFISAEVTLQNVVLQDNVATGRSTGASIYGAGIGSKLEMYESSLVANVPISSPNNFFFGAIVLRDSNAVLNSVTVANLSNRSMVTFDTPMRISDSLFKANASPTAVITANGGLLEITNTAFAGNQSVAVNSSGPTIIDRSRFTRNFWGVEALGPTTVTHSRFAQNREFSLSFGLQFQPSIQCVVRNSIFIGELPTPSAISHTQNFAIQALGETELELDRVKIQDHNSGAVAAYGIGTLRITDCEFSGNLRQLPSNPAATLIVNSRFAEIRNSSSVGAAFGDGLAFHGRELIVRDSLFALNSGSGIRTQTNFDLQENYTVIGSTIRDNRQSGLHLNTIGTARVIGCEISRNTNPLGNGGGIWLSAPSEGSPNFIVTNSLINENSSQKLGGAIFVSAPGGTLSLISNTIVKNVAGVSGAAIAYKSTNLDSLLSIELVNSILWGNMSENNRHYHGLATIRVTYCDLQDEQPGDGSIAFGGAANHNTDLNPRFVDWGQGNYRLSRHSPLLDRGSEDALTLDLFDLDQDSDVTETTPDLDRQDRVLGGGVDLGAYERTVPV
ncbi:MAG: right-handed parallel beta-helix repeat-containing protein [Pirellulaceae bacterium]